MSSSTIRSLRAGAFLVSTLAAASLVTSDAMADSTATGSIVAIGFRTPQSDTQVWDGYVSLNNGASYIWGGTNCSGFTALSTAQIQMIQQAQVNQRTITVYSKPGVALPCIVGVNFN